MSKKLKKRVQRLKRKWIDGFLMRGWRFHPSRTMILETTNVCTLKCSCCPNGAAAAQTLRQHGMMSRETFDLFLKQLDIPVKQCFLHMCGEPFLNKDLHYFAEQLLAHKIIPVIFSNGYQIDFELLERLLSLKGVVIAFSMDLLSKEHYEQIRIPGKYETCLDSLKRINEVFSQRKRFYGLNIILSELTVPELDTICSRLFQDYSNLNKISLSSMWPWPNIPQTGDIAGHLSKSQGFCKRIKELPVVLWNGDVSFCSFDYSGDLVIGNISEQSLSQLYNAKKTRRIRRHLLMGNLNKEPFCKNCLLPRYDNYSGILVRNKFNKMTTVERNDFFQKVRNYYDRK